MPAVSSRPDAPSAASPDRGRSRPASASARGAAPTSPEDSTARVSLAGCTAGTADAARTSSSEQSSEALQEELKQGDVRVMVTIRFARDANSTRTARPPRRPKRSRRCACEACLQAFIPQCQALQSVWRRFDLGHPGPSTTMRDRKPTVPLVAPQAKPRPTALNTFIALVPSLPQACMRSGRSSTVASALCEREQIPQTNRSMASAQAFGGSADVMSIK